MSLHDQRTTCKALLHKILMVHLLTTLSSIAAHYGELAKKVRAKPVSPFEFLQACGTVFKDENDKLLNYDNFQDTWQFTNELLKRLDEEATVKPVGKANAAKTSFVQDLFSMHDGVKVSRHCCKIT